MRGLGTALLKGWMWLVIAALYVPLGAMVLLSFNESRFGVFPFHFSLQWYRSLTPGSPLVVATFASLQLAVYVVLTCAVVGTGLGLWLAGTGMRRWKAVTNASLLATVTVPVLILSVGLLAVFDVIGFGQSVKALWLGCTVVSLPYMVFVVVARLRSIDPALAAASRSLGVGPVRTFWKVTFPLLRSAILAGCLMSFVVCFNNFTVQLFLAPIGVQTLPVNIYAQTRVGITPDINAVSSIIIVATVLLVLVLQLVTGSAARFVLADRGVRTDG